MSDAPLPTSLTDALRCGLAGSSQGQSGLFAFCSEAILAPFPFPRSPGLQVPSVDAGGRRVAGSSCPLSPGDPAGLGLPRRRWLPSPSWYMYSQLWWLDLVLNSELLKEREQRVSHTLTPT